MSENINKEVNPALSKEVQAMEQDEDAMKAFDSDAKMADFAYRKEQGDLSENERKAVSAIRAVMGYGEE